MLAPWGQSNKDFHKGNERFGALRYLELKRTALQ
jgi:hypothetical protein